MRAPSFSHMHVCTPHTNILDDIRGPPGPEGHGRRPRAARGVEHYDMIIQTVI